MRNLCEIWSVPIADVACSIPTESLSVRIDRRSHVLEDTDERFRTPPYNADFDGDEMNMQ